MNPQTPENHIAFPNTSALSTTLLANDYCIIPLQLTATRHMVASINIDNQLFNFLLDTGASHTCLHTEAAKRLTLTTTISEEKATGIGEVYLERLDTTVNSLTIGLCVIKDFALAIIDLSHVNQTIEKMGCEPIDGVLGADILLGYKAIIDYENNRLFLKYQPKEKIEVFDK